MSKPKAFSFLKGYSFSFEDDGRIIEAWFSSLSGLQKVFVDGTLVSTQRSVATETAHNFMIGDDRYTTTTKMVSLSKGPFLCTLSKNGNDIKRQKLVYPPLKNDLSSPAYRLKSLIHFVVIFLASAFLLYIAVAWWQLTPASIYMLFGFLFVIAVSGVAYYMQKFAAETEIVDEEIGELSYDD
ncbi:hypothetical protein CA11_02260 [Gimesia maris]|uniref:hypothetical protein n=1 Tax=Gimesia maris TaxID=122 RepID=UPI00118AB26C|nr:hypothetical protein [Gimesia maris]QDU12447.1 hypothetical protein CA11_02260 [Gimesia maris]